MRIYKKYRVWARGRERDAIVLSALTLPTACRMFAVQRNLVGGMVRTCKVNRIISNDPLYAECVIEGYNGTKVFIQGRDADDDDDSAQYGQADRSDLPGDAELSQGTGTDG